MKKIIFATGNEGKMREVRMILQDLGVEILSLKEAGIAADVESSGEEETVTGTIARIAQSVIDGNSHFYLVLEQDERIYDVAITDFVEIVRYQEGDAITLRFRKGDPLCVVTGIGEE